MSRRVFAVSSGLVALTSILAVAAVAAACSSSSTSPTTADGGLEGGTADTDASAACDEGKTSCAGTCADLGTDPTNCGSCGHSCGSTACASGVCEEQVLASGGVGPIVAVDDTNVYFSLGLDSGASLQRVPKNGGATVPLVSTGVIRSMTASGGRLVWGALAKATGGTLDDLVASCALPGCTSAMPAFAVDDQRRNFSVTGDASRMFWIVGKSAGRGTVESCPLGGCTGSPTSIAPAIGGSGQNAFVAVTKDHVFWAVAGGSLAHCAKTGGCDAGTSAVTGTSGVLALASDATHAYFWTAKGLFSCAAPDCAGGPAKIADNGGFDAVWVATDGKDVFFAKGVGGIAACPVTGCSGSPRSVSNSRPVQTGNLVVDDTAVYYVSSTTSQLVRVAK